MLAAKDPVDRLVEFVPTKAPYDPRWMLAGRPSQSKCMLHPQGLAVLCNFLSWLLKEPTPVELLTNSAPYSSGFLFGVALFFYQFLHISSSAWQKLV